MANVSIRSAIKTDLARCLTLDPSYVTDFVWQMESRVHDGQLAVNFRTAHLPRQMRVPYPRDHQLLTESWQACDAMLIAEDASGSLIGYATLINRIPQATVLVNDLIVAKTARRTGVGSALLKASGQWGREQRARWLMLELQTKNYPAISFAQKHGLKFCGFNDHYFANQDIALFFALGLH